MPIPSEASSQFSQDCHGKFTLKHTKPSLNLNLLLPSYLQTKALIKQHTSSFNYFINKQIKLIMTANSKIDSDFDPNFYIKFTDIRVRYPEVYDAQTGVSQGIYHY